ncbi:helix-turn-helix domain-containing protein [Altericroceibacterium endophyticum]|uniref:DUF4115 domain-containing protein n=1 Tax=Altericroceibacterium endophyticum TaxID=1808508 RepID=A0A6I4T5Z0_9SPHN|nr:helix-turn-helix domain-containing protein [Altericroceibacterium endophyticum]MXO66614.1 DUF4115 domain-containing protein [Altericroceibacterium endophyticum]
MAEELDENTMSATESSGVGPDLRAAREAKGLSVDEVAQETKIPRRHIRHIEAGEFNELPARTYAVGFSRTYAKLLDLDPEEITGRVRAELDAMEPRQAPRAVSFEPGDPARVPSGKMLWVVVVLGLALLAAALIFFRTLFVPAAELPPLAEETPAAEQVVQDDADTAAADAPATADAAASGPVVFTAMEDGIWVKFYDADGKQLMQKQMAKGESYTVPAEAKGPQLWTGRPDALTITVGGKEIGRLADDDQIMRDVPVTAQALLAR